MSPSLRTLLIFLPSSQDIHFLSPPDTPSVEFSRFPIDLIPLTPSVSIPPTDHLGTIPTAIIPIPSLDHEDLPVTMMPPSPLTSTPSQPTSPPPPPLRRSERPHKPPTCLTPCCTGPLDQFNFASTISFSPQFQIFLATIQTTNEPSSYREAVQYPEWREAMAEGFCAFHQTSTWDIVSCPVGVKPMSCKWIFKVKH